MVLICFKALKGLNVNVNLGKSEAAPLGRVGNIIKLAGIFHCKVWGGWCGLPSFKALSAWNPILEKME